ncbi:hypothetical protein A6V39_00780 [Candidatus Mycoplasma haematobovis]|uniref:Uncharacterized protein n=1 Tax=Candidatus Mycoplasma haematobovis TaxID=432608 RepID=A0A1A9QF60_9MOLU|nr:hypothetical protein [Candidatus Mycoplasma haematobovis]OAL10586.1 hypothetical protein A6V39_00780 [Candidatus Mycoplasma haematobovis]
MSYLTKAGMAVLSAGAIGGASYSGYVYFSGDSFAKKLGVSVLNLTGTDNSTEWTTRLNELNAKTSGLDKSLEKLKNKTWQELQSWCNSNQSNKFNKETDTLYQNFEEFCTWKVGDKPWSNKIASTVVETHQDWGTAHAALKGKDKNNLSPELKKVYEAESTDNKDKKAMHKWCTDNYKKTWTGDNDATLNEVKEYCKTA